MLVREWLFESNEVEIIFYVVVESRRWENRLNTIKLKLLTPTDVNCKHFRGLSDSRVGIVWRWLLRNSLEKNHFKTYLYKNIFDLDSVKSFCSCWIIESPLMARSRGQLTFEAYQVQGQKCDGCYDSAWMISDCVSLHPFAHNCSIIINVISLYVKVS